MGKYYWRKKDKVVVKRGVKRSIESSSKQVPAHNQVIWNLDTTGVQKGELDTVAAIMVFASANFDSVSQLCLALGGKEKEMQKAKLGLAVGKQRHEQEVN